MPDITPSDEQWKAIKAIKEWYLNGTAQTFYLAGYAGSGKAQPLSCEIQTPDGPKSMGGIEVGDVIFGRNGKPTVVTGVYPQGTRPTYRVSFRDGSTTLCCDDHLWMVEGRGSRPPKVVTTRHIIENGVRFDSGPHKFKIPLCEPVEYSERVHGIPPYTLGVLLGDGGFSTQVITLSLRNDEKQIIERISSEIGEIVDTHNYRDGSGCRQYIFSRKPGEYRNTLRIELERLGLLGLRGGDKFIPLGYLHSSVQQRMDLLRGLMDSDGSITNNRTSFSTKSPGLVCGIRKLVQSLGGTAIVSAYKRRGGTEYHVNVKMKENPFWIDKKASKWSFSKKNPPSRYITNIEYVGDERQCCISVDADDSLYLTDEFVVTHNTTIAKLAVAECGIDPDSSKDVRYGSYTGKAALVMQRKGMEDATTTHQMIYRLIDDTDELIFELNFENSPLLDAKLACLDECSMINQEMGSDLLKFGKKVLVLGDPGQLQPVRGQGFFTSGKPDFFLKEIHRQALENPIIRMSKIVRETGRLPMGDEGAFRKVRAEEVDSDELMQADQVLTGKHVSRHDLNRMLLDCHGYDLAYPLQKGVKVICIKNSRKNDPEEGESYQLLNGMIGYTSDERTDLDLNREKRHFFQSVEFPDEDMAVNNIPIYMGPFEEHWGVKVSDEQKERDKFMMRGFEQFDFGYAITTHKAQGSQWDDVFLFDDGFGSWDDLERKRWLYTAITRAAERVTVMV